MRSELEHARDIAKGEVPDQSKKHFNRYNGINESEMSLEYVKKKADTRAGKELEKQKILDEIGDDTEKPLIEFLETAKKGMVDNPSFTHIKRIDQILTDEGLKDIIADVKDTVVRVYTKEEQQQAFNELKGYKDYGSVRLDANGYYQILLNPNLSPSEARRTLYHELMHVKQFKRAETDPYYKKLIDNDTFKIENGIISEDYFNDVLEAEAKQAEIDWENLRGSNNGLHAKRSRDVQSKSPLQRGFIKENKGIEGRGKDVIRRGLSESRERNTSSLRNGSGEDRETISEQLKATDGDLNAVNKILDDVIARDTELSGTDWKALAEDADKFYAKIKEICGENITAFNRYYNSLLLKIPLSSGRG